MGRYVYNSDKVTQTIDELNSALNSIKNVTSEIQAGINTINSANGAKYIDADYSLILKFQEIAENSIEDDIKEIQSKVTIIEDYENAPWHKKLFSSIGMGLTKFTEGVVSGLENITDGAVSIAGFVGGIFNSDFKNSVAEYVRKDHVGEWFDKQYDSGFLSGMSKYSYFGKNSTAANIFKGFGTAAPYIALSMTGVGTTVEMVAAGLGGIGSGTEAGINKALANDPALKAGDVFNKAFGQGVWQGAKNAALVYAMNKIREVAVRGKQVPNTEAKNMVQYDPAFARQQQALGPAGAPNNIFTKAGKFADTRLGKGINAVDDIATKGFDKAGNAIKSTAGKIGSHMPGKQLAQKVFTGLTKNKVVNTVTNAVGKAVVAHPGVAYTAASTVFALDQVDEDVINSDYKVKQENIDNVNIRTPIELPNPSSNTNNSVGNNNPDGNDNSVGNNTPAGNNNPVGNNTPAGNNNSVGNNSPSGSYSPSGNYSPSGDSNKPSSDSNKPGSDSNKPSSDSNKPSSDTNKPNGDSNKPSGDTNKPSGDNNKPGDDSNKPSGNNKPFSGPTSSGGGYTEEGYTGEVSDPNIEDEIPEIEDVSGSISDFVGGNEYTNIPTSSAPISTTTKTAPKKSMIPLAAGLGAATVAGIGAKAYLDKKEEPSEESFDTEEWTEEDSLNVDYNEAMEDEADYLDPSDEYAYTEGVEENPEGSYEAVNSSELASMQ